MSETIVITSFLEPELVDRVRSAWDGDVLYESRLVTRPRYVADHGGVKPELDAAGEAEWRDMLSRAEICFDFDWWQPGRLLDNCPKLRWVQATSAGIGGFVRRFGLDQGDLVFTTAAGTHAIPLAEFALTGALYLIKGVPELRPDFILVDRLHQLAAAFSRVISTAVGSMSEAMTRLRHSFAAPMARRPVPQPRSSTLL